MCAWLHSSVRMFSASGRLIVSRPAIERTLLGDRPDGDWRVSEAETQWEIVPHTGLALQILDARLSPSPEHVDPVPVSPTRGTPRQSPKIRKGSQSAALPKRACRTATSMAGALCTHR